jgi:hypothetical protein
LFLMRLLRARRTETCPRRTARCRRAKRCCRQSRPSVPRNSSSTWDILANVERRWPRKYHELGPCLVWTGPTLSNEGVYGWMYGWMYDTALKRMDVAHRVVWRRCFGAIPKGPSGKTLEVDHRCDVTLCQRPDHLQLLSAGAAPAPAPAASSTPRPASVDVVRIAC